MPHAGCSVYPVCRSGEHIHCTEQRDLRAEAGSSTGIGCYAEYLLKPDYLLQPVPDDMVEQIGLAFPANVVERLSTSGISAAVMLTSFRVAIPSMSVSPP
jgi:threonine dehydrogenase-like Zn-dependent dehydrogenase